MGRRDAPRVGRPRKQETPLSRWLDRTGKSRQELADELGIARSHVDRLCRGDRRPSLELALDIEKLTDGAVAASEWASVPRHSKD